jgi:FkbM family methyltransferase
MTTLAHGIGSILPKGVAVRLRPVWHRFAQILRFFRRGGRLRFDRNLVTWIARRPIPGTKAAGPMAVAVRSMREFRRFAGFGDDAGDKLHHWLCRLGPTDVLWDIGSANGLEGFLAHHVSGCKVVFVEPFTPSIETILKTVVIVEREKSRRQDFEVVQAACDRVSGFGRLVTHTKPVAGETFNSIADDVADYCQGGRQEMAVGATQWVKTVTLDELHFDCGLPLPTHLKIDVDGLELRVIDGAARVLASGSIRACAIEVNDDHGPKVVEIMARHGYAKNDEYIHYQTAKIFTADYFFAKERGPNEY